MTLEEYERHLIGQLCWWCHRATHGSSGRQRQCPGCRAKWSYHRRKAEWELLRAFALRTTAHHAARVVRCSYPTAYAAYTRFRLTLQAVTDDEKRPLLGELELDESYFGASGRGSGAAGRAGRSRCSASWSGPGGCTRWPSRTARRRP
ncbi:MAG: hypothetical protein U0804_25165 [Gemmataceae bacterium]